MPDAFSTIKVEFNQCPPGCRLCEEACAREKGHGAVNLSRIKPLHAPEAKFHSAMTCVQCGQPRCQQICPAGAIEKSGEDGVVRIDEARCVGCGLCTVACPYGGIYFDSESHKSFKCDQCRGGPKCVPACPHRVLSVIDNRPVLEYLKEDLLAPGVAACR
jgi:Fe-S-cluster-containing hydrogenase component 2